MMKEIVFAFTFAIGMNAVAASTPLYGKSQRCLLSKIKQDPGNRYPVLSDVKAVNIFNEVSIMQSQDFKTPKDTMIVLVAGNGKAVEFDGDSYFSTKQTVSFLDKLGKPVKEMNDFDEVLQAIYTHSLSTNERGIALDFKAVHNVTSYVDHFYTNSVVVTYKKTVPGNVRSETFGARLEFKCERHESAKEILK